MMDDDLVYAHRRRALNPDNPFIRGTAQNPDVYFQGRESVNRFYDADARTSCRRRWTVSPSSRGRQYNLFDYYGDPQAERVIVLMGSGAETVHADHRCAAREGRRHDQCSPVPTVFEQAPAGGDTGDSKEYRRAGSHQGNRRQRRTAVPGCRYGHSPRRSATALRPAMPKSHRRPLRLVVQGVYAGDGQAVFDELAEGTAEESFYDRHQ